MRTANVARPAAGQRSEAQGRSGDLFSAHHDHFGIGEPDATGDKIYNGAEDNASGCAQLLAIARAFAALPERPRRSVLMLFVAGEEQGLLGSTYYSLHPTFAPGKIAANINYDGGNYLRPHARTSRTSARASPRSTRSSNALAASSRARASCPTSSRTSGYFYRSDQFNFAKIGVPALYFDRGTDYIGKPAGLGPARSTRSGTEHIYHQPSDEIDDSWVFDGMIEDASIGFYAGLAHRAGRCDADVESGR